MNPTNASSPARVRLAPSGTFERDFSYAVESTDRKTVAAGAL